MKRPRIESLFPIAVRRLLRAGGIKRVDLYAGRLLRTDEGVVNLSHLRELDRAAITGEADERRA